MPEDKGDAPPQRDPWILAKCDAGALDPPRWVWVDVRDGLQVQVMADVLSYGGVRLCGSVVAAQGVADAWDAMIMTPAISDAVWRAATVRIKPVNMDPNPGGAKAFMLYQADRVEAKLAEKLHALSTSGVNVEPYIIATLGKDYVLDSRAPQHKGQTAIYGWHTGKDGSDMSVIQSPLTGASYKHHLTFFDYSQSIRLVRRRCKLNGKAEDLQRIYQELPKLVNFTPAGLPCPVRYPAIPFRQSPAVPP